MQTLFEFFSLADPNVRNVVLGTMLLTSSTAMIGTFSFLRKRTLVGDAVAHAVLPGLCIAFLLAGVKHPIYLTLGAFVSGWMALGAIDAITRSTKLKEDTAIALVLSTTFGLGTLLLTFIQHSGNASQIGLSHFLLGKAAALVSEDLITLGWLSVLIMVTVWLLFRVFTSLAFDPNFSQTIGLPTRQLEWLLTSLMVLAIVIGIRAVGIVLIVAMLTTPPAAARFWTNHLPTMMLLAVGMAMIAGVLGGFISYIAPAMPTGPWIVLVMSFLAYLSFLLAPKRGWLARWWQLRQHQRKVLRENVLKSLYELGQEDGFSYYTRSWEDVRQHRSMKPAQVLRSLRQLKERAMVQQIAHGWRLTAVGKAQGEKLARLHRMWELYLTKYLHVQPDHVHEDAESIEHIITPAIAAELQAVLEKKQKATSD